MEQKSRYRVLVLAPLSDDGLEVLRAASDVQFDVGRWKRSDLLVRVGQYDALIVRSGTLVDGELLDRAPRLKVIGRGGAGFDGIDLAAATARGVMVMNTPQANSLAQAEHTLALLLALCRQLPAADAAVRRGEWDRTRFPGVQLFGKTLGLVGFGAIGRLVASRALAFGMDVLAYDPYIDDDIARQLHVTVTTLDDLLARSDFVSLHTALTTDTRKIIGPGELAHMKTGARLINAASSELVDEAALAEALVSGQLAGAALDGFVTEAGEHPLLELPNVIVTPRLGPHTSEALRDVSTQIAQQVIDALRGSDYRNVINLPFFAGTEFSQAQPYLDLAEKIGALHSQLARGRVRSVEVEIKGEEPLGLIKPIAVALLKGLLTHLLSEVVNYINAPVLAAERGILVSQTRGLDVVDYANLISCRVSWETGPAEAGQPPQTGQRLIAGTLFAGSETRVVQIDHIRMDAKPEGQVLIMWSHDVPGVIGKVGTLLHDHAVNIGEWRLGRDRPGGTALSFVNLDTPISPEGLTTLRALPEVIEARLVWL